MSVRFRKPEPDLNRQVKRLRIHSKPMRPPTPPRPRLPTPTPPPPPPAPLTFEEHKDPRGPAVSPTPRPGARLPSASTSPSGGLVLPSQHLELARALAQDPPYLSTFLRSALANVEDATAQVGAWLMEGGRFNFLYDAASVERVALGALTGGAELERFLCPPGLGVPEVVFTDATLPTWGVVPRFEVWHVPGRFTARVQLADGTGVDLAGMAHRLGVTRIGDMLGVGDQEDVRLLRRLAAERFDPGVLSARLRATRLAVAGAQLLIHHREFSARLRAWLAERGHELRIGSAMARFHSNMSFEASALLEVLGVHERGSLVLRGMLHTFRADLPARTTYLVSAARV